MWKYNHTDEMYTGKYDRSEKLYHSDVYLGQDYTDGIYHFKYIKREKKNGKWVYYYKDEALDKAKARDDRNAKALTYENKKRGYGNNGNYVYRHKGKDINDPVYTKLREDGLRANINYITKKKESDERKRKYEAVPIKALNTMSDVGYKIKKRINKGKKKIANLFKKNKKKK